MAENEEVVDKQTQDVVAAVELEQDEEQLVPDEFADQGETEEEDELAQTKKELAETTDKLLRLAADFENFKKRSERSRIDAMKYREESLLKELLPVIDNLSRAIESSQNSGESSDLLEGVELTHKGLINVLDKFEVKPLDSIGEPFDPNLHEALAMDHSDEVDENHVLVEFEKGYHYKDKLIRAAKVVVSKGAGA